MRSRLGFNFYDVFVVLFCVLFAAICFYPMWYVLIASVTPYEKFIQGGLMLWPSGGVDLQYYKTIFVNSSFVSSMSVSASVTVLGTTLSVLVTSAMAYAVSKNHVAGMKFLNALVVFNLFFTGGLIPQYVLYRSLGLVRNYLVMILPGALNIVYFIIMRNYFSFSVSPELEEAARIDGCNDIRVFFQIILPLSKPMIAAVGLFIAVIHWNDYYSYMAFIANKPELQPFAWVLRRILTDQTMMSQVRKGAMDIGSQLPPPMALRMATIICAMLPIIMVYPFLQKHFAKGVMIGAVKE
jgi:ABC-type glycerol-3-phosphate transport system permease component